MSEEKPVPTEEDGKTTPPSPGKKKQSVVTYLAIMFAAAFLLLLLAYFMQQRTSEQVIGDLKESVTSIESLDDLIEENRTLREQTDTLQEQNAALTEQLDTAQHDYETLTAGYHKYVSYTSVLETLYQAELLAADGDYEAADEVLGDLDPDFLSDTLAGYDAECDQDDGAGKLTPRYEALSELLEKKLKDH